MTTIYPEFKNSLTVRFKTINLELETNTNFYKKKTISLKNYLKTSVGRETHTGCVLYQTHFCVKRIFGFFLVFKKKQNKNLKETHVTRLLGCCIAPRCAKLSKILTINIILFKHTKFSSFSCLK